MEERDEEYEYARRKMREVGFAQVKGGLVGALLFLILLGVAKLFGLSLYVALFIGIALVLAWAGWDIRRTRRDNANPS